MCKSIINTLLLCLIGLSVQSQFLITDQETGYPIPYVVMQMNCADSPSDYLTSDNNGIINFKLSSTCEIKLSCIGYETKVITLEPTQYIEIAMKPSIFMIKPSVVTAQFSPTTAENAVQKIRVISGDQIERMGAVNLRDVLVQQQNVFITEDLSLGTSTSIAGLGGNQVKILVDGVPVIGRLDGNVDLSQINMNNVERIEIVEGPLSVEYGTDALAGTINIITKKDYENPLHVKANFQYETVGRTNAYIDLSGQKNKWNYQISGGRNYFNGFSDIDQGRVSDWKPKEQYFANWSLGRQLGNWRITYQGDYFHELLSNQGAINERQEQVAINDSISEIYTFFFANDEDFTTERINNRVSAIGQINDQNRVNGYLAFNIFSREKRSFRTEFADLSQIDLIGGDLQDTSIFHQWNSRASWSHLFNSNVSMQLGYDIQHETSFGKRVLSEKQSITDIAFFASSELNLGKGLTLRPGVRYANNSAYDAPVVPSLHAKWNNDRLFVRASYGKGFRAPSLKELYLFFVDSNHNIRGNDSLLAETSDAFQLSLQYKIEKGNWLIKPQVSGLYNKVNDMIDLALVDGDSQLFSYINISEAETFAATGQIEATGEKMRINLGVSFTGIASPLYEDFPELDKFNQSTEIFGTFSWNINKWQSMVELNIHQFGPKNGFTLSEDNEVDPYTIGNYSISNLMVSKYFWEKRINVAAGVNNIFDVVNVQAAVNSSQHSSSVGSLAVGTGRTYVTRLIVEF